MEQLYHFNVTKFNRLMGAAEDLHRDGEYQQALDITYRAHGMAPECTSEAGRAARDISARLDRLGRPDEATPWGEKAFAIHDRIVTSMGEMPSRTALRERSASAMYVGANGLRRVLAAKRTGRTTDTEDADTAIGFLRQAWDDIRAANNLLPPDSNHIDQYQINASRRVSLGETFVGDRATGLAIGKEAVRLAFRSESPKLSTANHSLDTPARLKAKSKALLGGIAALGINLTYTPEPGLRQRFVAAVADKML